MLASPWIIAGYILVCIVSLAAGFVTCAWLVSGRIMTLETGLRMFADPHNWRVIQEGATIYHAWSRGDATPPCTLAAQIIRERG